MVHALSTLTSYPDERRACIETIAGSVVWKVRHQLPGPGMANIRVVPYIYIFIVQELCESRGGRPGLSVLTSLLVSVDVKLY